MHSKPQWHWFYFKDVYASSLADVSGSPGGERSEDGDSPTRQHAELSDNLQVSHVTDQSLHASSKFNPAVIINL